jgi:arylsulfatase A-like enzyme
MNLPRLSFRIRSSTAIALTIATWIVCSVAASIRGDGGPGAATNRAPNILIVLADDLGFSDLGCYGSEIQTPNLDRLAKGGIRFTQFYNTARCWPTRGALLTGYYAQQIRRDQVDGVPSGNQGKRPAWAPLLTKSLTPLGYRSYHSGKWHIDGLPLQEGFDSSYRLDDHDRHFQPKKHFWNDEPLPAVSEGDAYHSSTEIANRTLLQWNQHTDEHPGDPFFSFVAFTAPHFPLQAPEEWVERCKHRYRMGWDQVRQDRWNRMRDLGLGTTVSLVERSLGPPYSFPDAIKRLGPGEVNLPLAWSDLNLEQQAFQVDKMAVHAAMVEHMDHEIGRLIEWLRDHGQLDRTVILFLSDNGASAEIMVRGDGHTADSVPGSKESYLCLGPGWSTVANTPFRKHKTWVHEGGICTPCILHWPAAVSAQPIPVSTPLHVIDVVPTLLEIAQGKPLSPKCGDNPEGIPPRPGMSFSSLLLPTASPWKDFACRALMPANRVLWWQHERNRAIREGDWKLVAAGSESPWELYNLRDDRSESNNIASNYPERVEYLAKLWETMRDDHRAAALRLDE